MPFISLLINLFCCFSFTYSSLKKVTGSGCDRFVDVAVVGAGSAGAYFAYRLRDAGLAVELFEYSDRVGGRLFTTTLPNIPDLKLELGGMRYIDGEHHRIQRLVHELNLTQVEFAEGFGQPERTRYYLRGQSLTTEDINKGNVPYDLSLEEKANLANMSLYYLEKLTGFNGNFGEVQALSLTVKDGRQLYKLTMDEALDLVATQEGKRYLRATNGYDGDFGDDITAVEHYMLAALSTGRRVMTLKEGMSSLPKSMLTTFLQSSHRHKVSMNKKLEAISERKFGVYELLLFTTTTNNGFTEERGYTELVCADKVVLAIPKLALTQLKWKPLRDPRVTNALSALGSGKANKIYLTFPRAWWLKDSPKPASVMFSDLSFRQWYDWKCSNKTAGCAMLASYADDSSTLYLQNLNSKGRIAAGSASGFNLVTRRLQERLLSDLVEAFDMDRKLLPEPISGISQFWTGYPYGGGWTYWKAGYNFTDVVNTLRRPSLTDDVFVVGSDFAFLGSNSWTEGALMTVDEIFDKYFT